MTNSIESKIKEQMEEETTTIGGQFRRNITKTSRLLIELEVIILGSLFPSMLLILFLYIKYFTMDMHPIREIMYSMNIGYDIFFLIL